MAKQPKNIVICADGTGNSANKDRGTNVFKLYEAVDRHGHALDPAAPRQVAIYHDGVGTENLKWLRIASGATGWGLSRNVKQLYGELARVYEPGDAIFLFGFSRGAFTVRTLAGLISACGILDPAKLPTNRDFVRAVRETYKAYRWKYQTWLTRTWRSMSAARPPDLRAVRERMAVQHPTLAPDGRIRIAFVGVWDTVDAVGAPFQIAELINKFYRFKFPDTTLSPLVERACHALALDEERQSFAPVIWNEEESLSPGRIEQVWFAGVHSNVGGGYPKQGMSLVTLDWMMAQAERQGLRFVKTDRELYIDHADVQDKLYDPRAGTGIFYRWQPRDVNGLCRRCGVTPKVHVTAFERAARNTDGYAPGTIPYHCAVVGLAPPPAFAAKVAADVQSILRKGLSESSLLAERRGMLRWGQLSYWVFMGAVVLALIAGSWIDMQNVVVRRPGWAGRAFTFLAGLFNGQWIMNAASALWKNPAMLAVVSGLLLAAYALEIMVDRSLDDHYSSFWHKRQKRLREALALTRRDFEEEARRALEARDRDLDALTRMAAPPDEPALDPDGEDSITIDGVKIPRNTAQKT